MPAALRHLARSSWWRNDASRRSGDAGRAAAERRPGPNARPRSGFVRRPYTDPALDGSGGAGPVWHHGLRALPAGRREAAGTAETQADTENRAPTGAVRRLASARAA